jgi:hypothetical protein
MVAGWQDGRIGGGGAGAGAGAQPGCMSEIIV